MAWKGLLQPEVSFLTTRGLSSDNYLQKMIKHDSCTLFIYLYYLYVALFIYGFELICLVLLSIVFYLALDLF